MAKTLAAALRTADGEFPRAEDEGMRIVKQRMRACVLRAQMGLSDTPAEGDARAYGRLVMRETIREASRIVNEDWI